MKPTTIVWHKLYGGPGIVERALSGNLSRVRFPDGVVAFIRDAELTLEPAPDMVQDGEALIRRALARNMGEFNPE